MTTISVQITTSISEEESNEIHAKEAEIVDDIRAYLESMRHAKSGPWNNLDLITIKSNLGTQVTVAKSSK